jgi:hypothetical protein
MTTKELKALKKLMEKHTKKAAELRLKAEEQTRLAAQYEFQIREHLNSE